MGTAGAKYPVHRKPTGITHENLNVGVQFVFFVRVLPAKKALKCLLLLLEFRKPIHFFRRKPDTE